MTKKKSATETADEIIELLGGNPGLSKINAYRLETIEGGIVFNIGEMELQAIVVIRHQSPTFAVAVNFLWRNGRGMMGVDGVAAKDLAATVKRLLSIGIK